MSTKKRSRDPILRLVAGFVLLPAVLILVWVIWLIWDPLGDGESPQLIFLSDLLLDNSQSEFSLWQFTPIEYNSSATRGPGDDRAYRDISLYSEEKVISAAIYVYRWQFKAPQLEYFDGSTLFDAFSDTFDWRSPPPALQRDNFYAEETLYMCANVDRYSELACELLAKYGHYILHIHFRIPDDLPDESIEAAHSVLTAQDAKMAIVLR